MPQKEETRKLSRSARLRKAQKVYSSLKNTGKSRTKISKKKVVKRKKDVKPKRETRKVKSATKKSRNITKVAPTKSVRRKLTDYQKFVKTESRRVKYKNMLPTLRMKEIAKTWDKKKRK